MMKSAANDRGITQEAKLPHRDWILLPLLGLLTICLIAGSTELIARKMFSYAATSVYNCMVMGDPSTGYRAIPNSVCWGKSAESPPVEYRFNSCGHRAGMECGPKPSGSYRIVMAGSSVAMGDLVQRDQTLAALLPAELAKRTGRKIDVYNEGMMQESAATIALRFQEFIAAKPDMILWILTPWDVQHASFTLPPAAKTTGKRVFLGVTRQRVEQALATKSIPAAVHEIMETLHDLLQASSSKLMLQHFLFESQSLYLKSALSTGDSAEFLKDQSSAERQDHLRDFDLSYAEIERQAEAAGQPLVVMLVPDRVQAAMLSRGEWPSGFDPYKLDNELRAIVQSHGGTYIDILPEFRGIPNAERYYLPFDGHPNAGGHRIVAGLLAKALTDGAVPELNVPAQPQVAQERAR
jgi:hypothetical protein